MALTLVCFSVFSTILGYPDVSLGASCPSSALTQTPKTTPELFTYPSTTLRTTPFQQSDRTHYSSITLLNHEKSAKEQSMISFMHSKTFANPIKTGTRWAISGNPSALSTHNLTSSEHPHIPRTTTRNHIYHTPAPRYTIQQPNEQEKKK